VKNIAEFVGLTQNFGAAQSFQVEALCAVVGYHHVFRRARSHRFSVRDEVLEIKQLRDLVWTSGVYDTDYYDDYVNGVLLYRQLLHEALSE